MQRDRLRTSKRNPYAENSPIVEFEKAHDYCEQQRKELRNERI